MKPRVLFIVPSDFEQMRKKGVEHLLWERDENGYFDRVVTFHPFASQTRFLPLSDRHHLYEVQEQIPPLLAPFKLSRYLVHLFYIAALVRQLLRLMDQEHITCIRATDPFFTGLLAWAVTRFRPIPYCVSIHADYDKRQVLDPEGGNPSLLGSRSLAKQIEKITLREATQVWPIRQSLSAKAQGLGVDADRIRVIPHGIDLKPFQSPPAFDIRKSAGTDSGTTLLSFVGRLTHDNYVLELIEFADRLRTRFSNFLLVVVGDGPLRTEMETQARARGLEANVRLVGSKPREWVIALRQKSLLSLCPMGGFSLIEACAAGSSVLAYDVEWHSELVKTDQTGVLLAEHDIAGMVEAVLERLQDPAKAKAEGIQAQKLAFEHHDLRKTSALKCRFYDEILGRAA